MNTVETAVVSVTAYAAQLARVVRSIDGAIVEGEVQRPKPTAGGMFCFELTDGDARLACKVFRGQMRGLTYTPKHGDLVQVQIERPDFYPPFGKLDVIVTDIELAGEGELLRRRAELLARLDREGLCDSERRKPLPRFPRAVGVIAGKDSEGMSDVIQALRDRFPPIEVVTCPALVQGKRAPRDLVDALARLQEHPRVDVIVVARGGGSVQDLVAFDDEGLCRAFFACSKPIVAAIGHTDNVPVCNRVTYAAYTPSRSAEMVVPSAVELQQEIALVRQALAQLPARVGRKLERLEAVRDKLRFPDRMRESLRAVHDTSERIDRAQETFFATREYGIAEVRSALVGIVHSTRGLIVGRDAELARQRERLDDVGQRLDAVGADVEEQSRRVGVGTARQLTDHERDYARALSRLIGELETGIKRGSRTDEEALAAARDRLHERVVCRVGVATRELRHVVELVDARDFRKRGFVLALDERGRPLPSVHGLRLGARLRLNFHDGHAEAVVDDIKGELP